MLRPRIMSLRRLVQVVHLMLITSRTSTRPSFGFGSARYVGVGFRMTLQEIQTTAVLAADLADRDNQGAEKSCSQLKRALGTDPVSVDLFPFACKMRKWWRSLVTS